MESLAFCLSLIIKAAVIKKKMPPKISIKLVEKRAYWSASNLVKSVSCKRVKEERTNVLNVINSCCIYICSYLWPTTGLQWRRRTGQQSCCHSVWQFWCRGWHHCCCGCICWIQSITQCQREAFHASGTDKLHGSVGCSS